MNIFMRNRNNRPAPALVQVMPDMPEKAKFDEDAINEILNAFIEGHYNAEFNIDGPVGQNLAKLASMMQGKAREDLERTVAFSSQASESMVSVAFVVEDVKHVGNDAQTMAAAVEQMAASINQVAAASSETSNAAQTAHDSALDSTQQISITTKAMQDISQLVGALSSRLEVLENAANQIEGMAQTIEDISDQTKLLALNATIEAARAGEAGKGFAVVASEVKSLSEQTSKATDNIRQRIMTLNNEMTEMKEAMSSSSKMVQHGEQMVQKISSQIDVIVNNVSSTNEQMSEIASVLEEQRNATGEISSKVSSIATRAAKTRDNIELMVTSVGNTEALIEDQFSSLNGGIVENCILYRAKSDHLIWKKKLAEMLAGLDSLDPSELSDHHSCRLGKWYDAVSDNALLANHHFKELLIPHEDVHRHGKLAAKHFHQGRYEDAKQEYALMETASIQVITILDDLIGAGSK